METDGNLCFLNRFGERISGIRECASKDYMDADGRILFDNSNNGFKIGGGCGTERVFLKKGTRIIRYGPETGFFASKVGTPFSELALPYKIRTCEYNEYEVMADDEIAVLARNSEPVEVEQGIVAAQPAWPSERGGGWQYYFFENSFPRPKHILYYKKRKSLRRLEVSEWSDILREDLNHP